MVDLSQIPHHKTVEDLSALIVDRVGNDDPAFYRPIIAHHMFTVASTMRAKIKQQDGKELLINGYTIALSPSGTGKGYSMDILEGEVFEDFRKTFTDHTLPFLADAHLWKLALQRAAKNGTEEQIERDKLEAEYEKLGEYLFEFDDAHPSAVKQIREKLLLARAGAINLVVDEVGSNLTKIAEALPLFLQLYDQGKAKQKAYMQSAERKRTAHVEGKTPTNMILFGTPSKLFDGSESEKLFYSLLEEGYARRCMFAFGKPKPMHVGMTPEQIYDRQADPASTAALQVWSDHFAALADPAKYDWTVDVPRDVGIALVAYKQECSERASVLRDDNPRKFEIEHRFTRALKLAGCFAFVEESLTMTSTHLHQAIKLVEESGDALEQILNREKPYMKLARYIASCDHEVSHADLTEELPFYKASPAVRKDMLSLATSWGYKHHIIIKRHFLDDMEFFTGEALEETSLDALQISHSEDWTHDFSPELATFQQLGQLATMPNYNWTTHAFQNGHRLGEKAIPGFNLAVFDLDGSLPLKTVHDLMEDFTFMTYTTKRHTPEHNRFRLILPMNYKLKLNREDYREFMGQLINWLPFEVDDVQSTKDIARKWLTNEHAQVHFHETGQLLDVLPFIPRTKRNEDRVKSLKELGDLDALERWISERINSDGLGRNNYMIRYALTLVDAGMDYMQIESKVLAFNARFGASALTQDELRKSVLVTVAKRLQARAAA